LQWFETQLGLPVKHEPWRRIAAVHAAIESAVAAGADAGRDLPIAMSFAAHPYAVAKHLIELRDDFLMAVPLVGANAGLPDIDDGVTATGLPLTIASYAVAMAAGIKGEAGGANSGRLRTEVAIGTPDRLCAVRDCLQAGQQLPACRIDISEPKDEWPARWVSLLVEVERTCPGVTVAWAVSEPPAQAAPGSSLAVLQDAIGATGAAGGKAGVGFPAAPPDRSLQAVRFRSVTLAVQAAAAMIHELAGGALSPLGDVIIICEDDATAALLDGELHARGLPTTGAATSSPSSDIRALLPLVLEASGWPADPRRLLEFLALPDSPVPIVARHLLAAALRAQPAIGSPAWMDALQEADALVVKSAAAHPEDTDRLVRWRTELARYLPCRPTPPARTGFVVGELVDISKELGAWALRRSHMILNDSMEIRKAGQPAPAVAAQIARRADRASEFMALWSRCRAFVDVAASLDRSRVLGSRELLQMLDAIEDENTSTAIHMAAAGGPRRVRTFAEIDERGGAATRVIWLGTDSQPIPQAVWSRSDIVRAANTFGISLDAARGRASAVRRAERRGLRHVADALLVMSYPATESGGRPHPLWTVICELFRPTVTDSPVYQWQPPAWTQSLAAPSGSPWVVRGVERPVEPLPRGMDEWRLPAGLSVPARDTISWTDAERRLSCPLAWTLHYGCRLTAAQGASLPNDSLLFGIAGEHVLRLVFPTGDRPRDEADALGRLDAVLETHLPRLHAGLSSPAGAVSMQRFKVVMRKAVAGVQRLVACDVDVRFNHDIATFTDAAGKPLTWAGAQLAGLIDAVGVATVGGRQFAMVLDEKFAGPDSRRKLLGEARPWQLLLYADALGRADKPEPLNAADGTSLSIEAIGYVILAEGTILVPEWYAGAVANPPFDKVVTIVPSAAGIGSPSAAVLMRKLEAAAKNATQQLATPGGTIVAHPRRAATGVGVHPHLAIVHGTNGTEAADEACEYCDYGLLCGRQEVT